MHCSTMCDLWALFKSLFIRLDSASNSTDKQWHIPHGTMLAAGIKCNIPQVLGYMHWKSSLWREQFPHVLVYDTEVYAFITTLLESSCVNMSSENVSPEVATSAVTSLEGIHKAGIL